MAKVIQLDKKNEDWLKRKKTKKQDKKDTKKKSSLQSAIESFEQK
jgi:hypothetical protein